MVMSDAERQRKRRLKLKAESKKNILVRGEGGEFDERIRISLAVKKLALDGRLPAECKAMIIKEAETIFPTKEVLTRKYINKIISAYLTEFNEKDKK